MPTTSHAAPSLFTSPTVAGSWAVESHPVNGNPVVMGVEVFRAGTFRDSLGEQSTWTVTQLEQMALNFKALKESGLFPNVPWRSDHSWSIDKVKGYIHDLYVRGDRLVADVEVTEPDALEKIQRGTYRARSAEVGMYLTNDEVPYYPTLMGVAFVDIPAVEGLFRGDRPVACFSYSAPTENPTTKENEMPEFVFKLHGKDTSDHTAVQAHVFALEKAVEDLAASNAALTTENESLAAAQKRADDERRKAFVSDLATSGKILAAQAPGLTEFALSLTEAQYESFTVTYALAPVMPILSRHTGSKGDADADVAKAQEIADCEAMLKSFAVAGMTPEALQKTKPFRRLIELGIKPAV